eukprot:scaffold58805_cov25-Tisochrysis_lutea.AAC.3
MSERSCATRLSRRRESRPLAHACLAPVAASVGGVSLSTSERACARSLSRCRMAARAAPARSTARRRVKSSDATWAEFDAVGEA